MSTKVEQASTIEPGSLQTTAIVTSSAASMSNPKISRFAAKSGFVIPKNKLSGSLVPIYRGGKKPGSNDASNEENTKQMQRKTKWGPDLTEDASVRKGRALAYQTRVDQITQQPKSGILETGDKRDLSSASHEKSYNHIDSENSELLELERREAIGEILKLNPSHKAPADYKPLLKEAKVPIPFKDYPGYNFVGLIFGTASDTQKRLEKETGATVRVCGIKADGEEMVEISRSDGNELYSLYEELYVHVSADTYEKVDAAVALIELLVTPVSVNPVAVSTSSTEVSGDNVNANNLRQDIPALYIVPPVVGNQGVAQPMIGSAPAVPQGQFQSYPGAWFSTGPPTGFVSPLNPSPPVLSNPVQASSSLNPSNMPSLFGPRPILATGFGSVSQNPSILPPRLQMPSQVLPCPYMPPSPLGHAGQSTSVQLPALQPTLPLPGISAPPPFSGNQPQPIGTSQPLRPMMSSMHQSGPPSNISPMAPPVIPPRAPYPLASQPVVSGTGNLVSPSSLASQLSVPPLTSTANGNPIAAPTFNSFPGPQVGLSSSSSLLPTQATALAPTPLQSASIAPNQPAPYNAFPSPASGSAPILSLVPKTPPLGPLPSGNPNIVSAGAAGFTPTNPPLLTNLKPQRPSSSDFTFQPHRPALHSPLVNPSQTMQPPPAPQFPSFRPAMPSSTPPPVMQGFPRPQVDNQMIQPRMHLADTFVGNPSGPTSMLRPRFPNQGPVSPTDPALQMGPRNLGPASQVVNAASPFPPRQGNPMQLQQNYTATSSWPRNQFALSQQSLASGAPRGHQIYDPFSPSSVQLGGNSAKVRKQESDPEYEDLMASVGVK